MDREDNVKSGECTTEKQHQTLRQMAIWIESLDPDTADQLIDQFDPSYQQQIRAMILTLADVSPDEQRAAADVFHQLLAESNPPIREAHVDGSSDDALLHDEAAVSERVPTMDHAVPSHARHELAVAAVGSPDVAVDFESDPGSPAAVSPRSLSEPSRQDGNMPILTPAVNLSVQLTTLPSLASLHRSLRVASIDALCDVLQDEQPQSLAVVLAALSPHHGATFLSRWPTEVQSEIVRRVVDLNEADEAIIDEFCDILVSQLARTSKPLADGKHLPLLQSIMSAIPRQQRDQLVDCVARTDRQLARTLTSKDRDARPSVAAEPSVEISFDRLVDLETEDLVRVFTEIPRETALLALAGASQPCLVDILRRLPKEMSSDFSHGMQDIGRLRLSDVHAAQGAAVDIGRRILAESAGKRSAHLKLSA